MSEDGGLTLPRRDEPEHVRDARTTIAALSAVTYITNGVELPADELAGLHSDLAGAHAILAIHYRDKARRER